MTTSTTVRPPPRPVPEPKPIVIPGRSMKDQILVKVFVLPTCSELGIGFVPFSPLGKGFLTGTVTADTQFTSGDIRASIPRFTAENRTANQGLVDHVTRLARARDVTPGQVAIAWLLARHSWIVPIPGTRRLERIEENAAATRVPLSADELADLDDLATRVGVRGDRYNEDHMSLVGH